MNNLKLVIGNTLYSGHGNDIGFKGENHKGKNKRSKMISLISIVVGMLPTLIVRGFSLFASLNIVKKTSTIIDFISGYIILIIIVILAITLQVIIHELGHMIFGLITGYSFLFFRIGKFTLIKQDGKMSFKKLPHTG